MPPKRKTPGPSTPAASTPSEVDVPMKGSIPPMEALGPWTDEQETALFKSMIQFKPAGMHKHFRMLSISNQIKAYSYSDGRRYDEQSLPQHLRIPGIWLKLRSLYNLDVIDGREDSLAEEGDSQEGADEFLHEFELPREEYGEAMFDRRLNPEGSASPSRLDKSHSPTRKRGRRAEGSFSGRGSTVGDTDDGRKHSSALELRMLTPVAEPQSSPVSIRGRRARGRGRGGVGRSKLQNSRVSRRASGTASAVADSDEEEAEEEGGSDESNGEEEDEDEEEEEEEVETEGTGKGHNRGRGASRAGRAARGGRGDGRRSGRRK